MTDFLSQIKKSLFSQVLPSHSELFDLAQQVSDILDAEISTYRESSIEEIPGALLDFYGTSLPVLVVPDIHARPGFIFNILNYKLKRGITGTKETVIEALGKKHIIVVCVGDALHTERTRERWLKALEEFENTYYHGPAMSEEMLYGLNTIIALMQLKIFFPENFHFLKGNHENITNRTGEGDYAFKKYADEGEMVRKFIFEVYGDDVLYMLSCVENSMPLVFCTQNCVISHAEPRTGYSRYKIINARLYPEVIEGLTWTDNDTAEEGSVEAVYKNLMEGRQSDKNSFIYLGGHRTVPENYLERQQGKYIQFHNPGKQNVALIVPGKKFNPDHDIVNVE